MRVPVAVVRAHPFVEVRSKGGGVRDDEAMDRALALGATARRRAAPNPWVGCVLVRDGVVVGEGATRQPGSAHAEIEALRAAGDDARGACAYVTLEPCAHHGRTGPCADALIEAGVARVVIGCDDPDEKVAGAGCARLRDSGVDVARGVRADKVADQLAPYLHHRRTGRAFAVCKVASSLDARIAAADGTSKWITGPLARKDVHELRADSQAIVVGSGTALVDLPSLTVRDADPAPAQPPARVLLDARGRVPAIGPLFDTGLAPTIVVTTDQAPATAVDAWRAAGAKVETVEAAVRGGVDLAEVLALLGRHGVLQAMFEGGGTLLGAMIDAGLANRLVVYVAPLLLGENGALAYSMPGPPTVDDAQRWHLAGVTTLGPDVRLDYELAAQEETR